MKSLKKKEYVIPKMECIQVQMEGGFAGSTLSKTNETSIQDWTMNSDTSGNDTWK